MIKFFHQLSEDEFKVLCDTKMTWEECAREYPQPQWCGYPEAVQGVMGCWSLMDFLVTGRSFCRHCDCYIKKPKKSKDVTIGGGNGNNN